jgi:hypothetical protein
VEAFAFVEKSFVAFWVHLASGLAHLREVYERNIQSLSVICSPIPGATPSIEDYILWLTSEVGYLPEVFASVNENFVSAAIEGVLTMPGELTPLTWNLYEWLLLIVEWISFRGCGMSEGPLEPLP